MSRVRLGLLLVGALGGLGLLVPAHAAAPRQATDGTDTTEQQSTSTDHSSRNRNLLGIVIVLGGLSVLAWSATAGGDDDEESAVQVGLGRFTRLLELPKPNPPTGARVESTASAPVEPEVGGLGRFARVREGEAPPL